VDSVLDRRQDTANDAKRLLSGVCFNGQSRNSGRVITGIALLPVGNTDTALIPPPLHLIYPVSGSN
jgi:hypothetical protein